MNTFMSTIAAPNAIESTSDPKPILRTRLGQLPIEIFQNVSRHLSKPKLVALACISPEFRDLTRRRLYHTIDIPCIAEETDDSPSR
jgi:hypothetical protein